MSASETTPRLYYNPRCSKCREALALLNERGVEPEIVEYLQDPPSEETLRALLAKLAIPAAELVRTKEHAALELPATDDEDTLISRLSAHPEIIQRPILELADRARVCRPAELVLEVLDA